MKRILVINPNTSASVTDMVLASCRLAFPEVAWEGATGRLGAACIASEAAYTLAAHAALDAYAACYTGHDAVLLACFGDPGLLALRQVAVVPVVGLAQASLQAAARPGAVRRGHRRRRMGADARAFCAHAPARRRSGRYPRRRAGRGADRGRARAGDGRLVRRV